MKHLWPVERDVGGEWLRQYAPAEDGAPCLVCLPHAGGSASFYLPLAKALTPAVRVLAVQYPGRLDRRGEPAVEDVRGLARRVLDVLSVGPGAFAFFGHSMGALVAYEATRLAEDGRGPVPEKLFVSAARAPHLVRTDPGILRDDRSLLDEVSFLGGTSPDVLRDADLRELVLPGLRADYRALCGYGIAEQVPVGRPVAVLVGDRDPRVGVDEAAAWRDYTTESFCLEVLSGGHFYLTSQFDLVADGVRASLRGGRV